MNTVSDVLTFRTSSDYYCAQSLSVAGTLWGEMKVYADSQRLQEQYRFVSGSTVYLKYTVSSYINLDLSTIETLDLVYENLRIPLYSPDDPSKYTNAPTNLRVDVGMAANSTQKIHFRTISFRLNTDLLPAKPSRSGFSLALESTVRVRFFDPSGRRLLADTSTISVGAFLFVNGVKSHFCYMGLFVFLFI
jgi:hypothetical protein